jgi:hypothetical protein
MSFSIIQSPNTYAASNNYMWSVVKSTTKPDWNYIDNNYWTVGTYTGYLAYTGSTAHGFKAGDNVYITQNAGYAFEGYGGSKKVLNVPNTKAIIVDQIFTYSTPLNPGTIQYQPPLNYYIQFALYNADTLGSPLIQSNIKTYPTVNNGTAAFDMHKVLNNYVSYDTMILSGVSNFYPSTNMIFKYRLDCYEYTGSTIISTLTAATTGYALNAALDRNNNFDFSTFQMATGTKGKFLSPWIGERKIRYDDRCTLSFLNINANAGFAKINITGTTNTTYYLDNPYQSNTAGYTNWKLLNLGCGHYEIENSSLWYDYYSQATTISITYSNTGTTSFVFSLPTPLTYINCDNISATSITDALGKLKTAISSYEGFNALTAVTGANTGTLILQAPSYHLSHVVAIGKTGAGFTTSSFATTLTGQTSTRYFATNILTKFDASKYDIELKLNTANAVSEVITFDIDKDCALTEDEIQIIWLNAYGGFDSYTFYRQINKYYSRDVTTFRKNDYSYNAGMKTGEYDYGTSILSNSIYENYKVKSKWLSNDMSKNVSSLFASSNVFARINDKVYSIIINGDAIEVINNKNRDQAIYEFEFELSNQNNTQKN